jgi:hypothetical protein
VNRPPRGKACDRFHAPGRIHSIKEHEMKKLIITFAVATSMLASTAAADPGSNTCHRLLNAIASGTRISALPPQLVRACFGDNGPVVVRPAAVTRAQPVAATPARR